MRILISPSHIHMPFHQMQIWWVQWCNIQFPYYALESTLSTFRETAYGKGMGISVETLVSVPGTRISRVKV